MPGRSWLACCRGVSIADLYQSILAKNAAACTMGRAQIRFGLPTMSPTARIKQSPLILTNSEGKPWTADGFRSSWRKACAAVGIVGVTFHDLRGTAVTRLALAGCTEAEIATITGHSLRDVRTILDSNYLSRDPALGESAIRKLERGTKISNRLSNRSGMFSSKKKEK